MIEAVPHLGEIDAITPAEWGGFGTAGEMGAEPFASPVANYYMTDPISRASETMAKCTAGAATAQPGATGTGG